MITASHYIRRIGIDQFPRARRLCVCMTETDRQRENENARERERETQLKWREVYVCAHTCIHEYQGGQQLDLVSDSILATVCALIRLCRLAHFFACGCVHAAAGGGERADNSRVRIRAQRAITRGAPPRTLDRARLRARTPSSCTSRHALLLCPFPHTFALLWPRSHLLEHCLDLSALCARGFEPAVLPARAPLSSSTTTGAGTARASEAGATCM